MTEERELVQIPANEQILSIVQSPDGKFSKGSNKGAIAETNLAKDFKNRWWLRGDDRFKYDVQLATDRSDPREDTVTLDGEETEVNVLMRVWKTVKDDDNTSAVCYKLVKDGPLGRERWIVESTIEKPEHNEETNINTWNIGEARYADEAEIQQLVTTLSTLSQK